MTPKKDRPIKVFESVLERRDECLRKLNRGSKRTKTGQNPKTKTKKTRKDGFGAFKGMKTFTADDELSTHD